MHIESCAGAFHPGRIADKVRAARRMLRRAPADASAHGGPPVSGVDEGPPFFGPFGIASTFQPPGDR